MIDITSSEFWLAVFGGYCLSIGITAAVSGVGIAYNKWRSQAR